jgi:hypothetical protein
MLKVVASVRERPQIIMLPQGSKASRHAIGLLHGTHADFCFGVKRVGFVMSAICPVYP